MKIKINKFIITTFFIISILSCFSEYQSEEELEKQYNSIPNISFKNLTQVNVKYGRKQYVAKAEKANIFNNNQNNKMILDNISFYQFDKKEKAVTSGKADKASLDFKTSNVTIEGNIDIYSKKEEAKITTNYLVWEDKNKIIKGNLKEEIKITKDNGTEIAGKGFKVDTKKNIITFQKEVSGFFVKEEEEDKKKENKDKEAKNSEEKIQEEVKE